MTHPLHASLIRILNADGAPLGMGFLAAPNLAVTCAHVVRAVHPQDDTLQFDFPLLAPGALCSGHVVYRDEAADIAAVEVSDPPDEIGVEFGLKLSAEAGAIIAAGGMEANYKVTLTWKQEEKKAEKATRK